MDNVHIIMDMLQSKDVNSPGILCMEGRQCEETSWL